MTILMVLKPNGAEFIENPLFGKLQELIYANVKGKIMTKWDIEWYVEDVEGIQIKLKNVSVPEIVQIVQNLDLDLVAKWCKVNVKNFKIEKIGNEITIYYRKLPLVEIFITNVH